MQAEPPKAEPPKRKRRQVQFRLRTLMIGVTLLAVPMGYVGWQAKIVRERKETLKWLSAQNCRINTPIDTTEWAKTEMRFKPCTTWVRRLLGDQEVIVIVAGSTRRLTDDEIEEVRQVFPGVLIGHEAK